MPNQSVSQVLYRGQQVNVTGSYTTDQGRKVAYITLPGGRNTAVYASELTVIYQTVNACTCNGVEQCRACLGDGATRNSNIPF